MCLNKNLITRFDLCLEKKKWYDIETLSIDRVLNKKHFNGQIIQKMCTKSPDLFKFMQANSWHHKLFHFHLFYSKSGKCGKEGEKFQKFEYLEKEKSFLDKIKNIFHSFWRAIIWWKNENFIKLVEGGTQ